MTFDKVVKYTDLSSTLGGEEQYDTVVMTAEIPPEDERGGDVVRVKGLRTPEEGWVPLLAGHETIASDGSPTVIGKAYGFGDRSIPWRGKQVPSKTAKIEWADTELAGKYKQLWPRFINKTSIGFLPTAGKPTETGFDYTEGDLLELSIVPIPANPAASHIRHIKSVLGKDAVDVNELLFAELKALEQRIDKRLQEFFDDFESLAAARNKTAGTSGSPFGPRNDEDDALRSLLLSLSDKNSK